jgi:hypothetical protein
VTSSPINCFPIFWNVTESRRRVIYDTIIEARNPWLVADLSPESTDPTTRGKIVSPVSKGPPKPGNRTTSKALYIRALRPPYRMLRTCVLHDSFVSLCFITIAILAYLQRSFFLESLHYRTFWMIAYASLTLQVFQSNWLSALMPN